MATSERIVYDIPDVLNSYILFLIPRLLLLLWEFFHKNYKNKWEKRTCTVLILCVICVGLVRITYEFYGVVLINNRKEEALLYIHDALEAGVPVDEILQEMNLYYEHRTKWSDPAAMFQLGENLRQKSCKQREVQ